MEQSEVQYGTTPIAYTVIRGRRKKTVAIAVDSSGVLLRAPAGVPLKKLDEIVLKKARWITQKKQRQSDLPPAPDQREFVSGETFLYLGRQYRLKVIKHGEDTKLIGGWLVVPGDQAEEVRRQLVNWYKRRAVERIPERVAIWSKRLGEEPADVLIRDQQKRWGSCTTKGVIRINWRIIQAPLRVVDYVVVHELVHLRRQHHTRAFWADIGRVMNDYDARREKLRRLGRVAVW